MPDVAHASVEGFVAGAASPASASPAFDGSDASGKHQPACKASRGRSGRPVAGSPWRVGAGTRRFASAQSASGGAVGTDGAVPWPVLGCRVGSSGSDTGGVTGSGGGVLVLLEADYRYGLGTLTLRVERVDQTCPDTYAGATWYRVEGVQVGGNGADISP